MSTVAAAALKHGTGFRKRAVKWEKLHFVMGYVTLMHPYSINLDRNC